MNVENCKKNDYISIVKPNGAPQKKTWNVDGYCRTNKKYQLTDIEDINNFKYLKKGTKVFLRTEY